MCEGGYLNLCLASFDDSWWGVCVEAFVFVYSMIGIAIIADDYLVVSLETLCVRWHVREDVAGATLMAFGSAAPEIIINAVSTLRGGSDLGVGAIVGSGMIAFLVIPSVSAIFAYDRVLKLKRRPLTRDIVFYAVSLALLCVFFNDGVVELAEALTLCAMYVVYICVVVFSPRIRRTWRLSQLEPHTPAYNRILHRQSFVVQPKDKLGTSSIQSTPPRATTDVAYATSPATPLVDDSVEFYGIDEMVVGDSDMMSTPNAMVAARDDDDDDDGGDGDGGCVQSFYGTVTRPLTLVFEWTCPTCEHTTANASYYPITFAVSFFYISLFSTVVSTVVSRWVTLSGVSLSFFGVVLIALGAEIPDTIQSVTVAKRGYGSMSVSNCIGSQICNILVGLGVPWAISNLAGHTVKLHEHKHIQKAAFIQAFNVVLVFSLLIGMAIVQGTNKALLTEQKGHAMLVFYGLALTLYAVLIFVPGA